VRGSIEVAMSSFLPYRGCVVVLAALAALFAAPDHFLAVRACDEVKVKVSVVVVLATEQNNKIDKKLINIAAEIQLLNPKLTGFTSPKETCKDVVINVQERFELVEKQVLTITIEKAADKENKNLLRVSAPTLGEIYYSTTCGKFLPIITEYKTKEGEILILAIRVQPCRDK
jgi:hypothetical protein